MDRSAAPRLDPDQPPPVDGAVSAHCDPRELVERFESLGGCGHGAEFFQFQRHYGANPTGLLASADLGPVFLASALEARLEGVGLPENTTVFAPDQSKEWWTKDKRYWMAMRSAVRTAEFTQQAATSAICATLQARRQTLLADLQAGTRIFVYKNQQPNLTGAEVDRLHAAVRSCGPATLFYVRHADETHPAGTVETPRPGLLTGYLERFAYSADNDARGPVHAAWLELCARAVQCLRDQPVAEPSPVPPAGRPSDRQSARKIVLIGNCQMQAMAGLYRRFAAGRRGDILFHVPSYQDLTPDHRDTIEQADIVVEQLFDLKPQADTDMIATTTPRILIPMVTAAFLWPFAGSPHPRNTGYAFLPTGPYGGEAADSYLNRQIAAGTEPQAAVETYANLDVNKRVNLDRLFELVIDRQRARDAAADYDIAGLMVQHFRTEQIFLSPYHPNVRVATALASRFFAGLGADRSDIERMQSATRITPFPKSELPIHPAVCRHFGLEFVAPDRRYRFLNEGLFTFREYALRYMRYEWNDAIEQGISLLQSGNPHAARETLTAGLARSPASAAGHNAISHAYSQTGARGEALAAIRQAVALEPGAAAYRANLGTLLRQTGKLDHAIGEFRSAVAADPGDPHYHLLLCHALRQQGDLAAAGDGARAAIRLDPYTASYRAGLAAVLEAGGDLSGAMATLQDALAMEPDHPAFLLQLAEVLGRLQRFDEAIAVARRAIDLSPAAANARVVVSDLLLRQGNSAAALDEAYLASVTEPDSAPTFGHLGHVLLATQDLSAAEIAFRRAATLDPARAHFQHDLSIVLNRQGRFTEAVAAARAAAACEPGNPHRLAHVASLLAQRNDLSGAQAALRQAIDLAPDTAAFHATLNDLMARSAASNRARQSAVA